MREQGRHEMGMRPTAIAAGRWQWRRLSSDVESEAAA